MPLALVSRMDFALGTQITLCGFANSTLAWAAASRGPRLTNLAAQQEAWPPLTFPAEVFEKNAPPAEASPGWLKPSSA